MATPFTPLQSAAEDVVLSWPDVRVKRVFGQRAYIRSGKMFAFLLGDGIAFKAPTAEEAERLYASGAATPFSYAENMESRGWPVVPLDSDDALDDALTRVRAAYESVG